MAKAKGRSGRAKPSKPSAANKMNAQKTGSRKGPGPKRGDAVFHFVGTPGIQKTPPYDTPEKVFTADEFHVGKCTLRRLKLIIRADGTGTFQADFTSDGVGDVWLIWITLFQGHIPVWNVEQHDSDSYPGVGVTPFAFGFNYASSWFQYIDGASARNHC
jgi:hypothetical protein